MSPNVNYRRVVDALTDAIGELNRAPHAPHAPHAELSAADVEGLLYKLLLDGEGTHSIGDAAAYAAAEHRASSQEFAQLLPFVPLISTVIAGLGLGVSAWQAFESVSSSRRRRRRR